MDQLCQYVLWLFIYSVVGWVYESIICSIDQRKLVNRGFLYGPYCPIYGFGALIDIMFLGDISSPIALFLSGMVLCSTLEYLTSWLMERLFHARWWDYSAHAFNLGGRICLMGAVVFGSMSVVLVMFIHPWLSGLTARIPSTPLYMITGGVLALFFLDIALTTLSQLHFNQKLATLQRRADELLTQSASRVEALRKSADEALESMRANADAQRQDAKRQNAQRLDAERLDAERLKLERQNAQRLDAERQTAQRLDAERQNAQRLKAERLDARERHLLKTFPAFHHTSHNDLVEKLKDLLRTDAQRRNKKP
ncbi:MAG: hypothetical protein RSK76_00745 [Clostridia bacterium]